MQFLYDHVKNKEMKINFKKLISFSWNFYLSMP